MGNNEVTADQLKIAVAAAATRRSYECASQQPVDSALMFDVCPRCTGALSNRSTFLDSLFSRVKKVCSGCGATHTYYLGDD